MPTILKDQEENLMVLVNSTLGELDMQSIRAKLFEQLVLRTQGTLTRYISDLYHDAGWIKENLTVDNIDGFEFYFGVRDSGTDIGTGTAKELMLQFDQHVWYLQTFDRSDREGVEKWTVRAVQIK